jgi:hypothetical protein
MNIYAATSALTNAPSFYWSLYQVDSDGVSNPVLIADGSAHPIQITNLVSSQVLYDSPLYIPATTLPTGKRVSAYLYAVYQSGSRTATFEFRTGAVSHIHTTIGETAYNWSTFPATSDVNIAGYNISNVGTLNSTFIQNSADVVTGALVSTNIVNPSSTTALTVQSPSNDTNISGLNVSLNGQYSVNETADVGSAVSNYASYGTINITGKGGLGGLVNITADVATPSNPAFTVSQLTMEAKGNYGNFVLSPPNPYLGYVPRGGLVSIIARQGLTPSAPATVTSGLVANGEIDLTAYSYTTSTGIVPGLIKLTSGANAMYAGTVTPVTGIFGNNYIYGQYGNSITAGLPSGGLPIFVGTNYLYGYNGTIVENGLYVDTIYNKYGGDLNINVSKNFNLTGGGGSQYVTFTNAGTSMQFAGPNLYFTSTSGGANFNIPVAIGTAYSLNLQNAPINGAQNINFTTGVAIRASSNIFDIIGPGSNGYLSILSGGGAIQIGGDTNIYLTGGGAALGFVNSVNIQNSGMYFNGTSPINMNSNIINTVGTLNFVSGGGSLCNVSNIFSPSSVYSTTNMQIINQQNILAISSPNTSNGSMDIIAGSNYHRIQMPAATGMTISSSNAIQINSPSNQLQFYSGSNITMCNTSNSIAQTTGTDIISSNYMNMHGSAVTISNNASTNTLSLGFGTAGAQLISSNYVRISNAYNNFYLDTDAKLTSSGQITVSNVASSMVMTIPSTIVATGGSVAVIGGRKYHTFTASGTFTIVSGAGATIEVMAIGGGGGGGVQSGGGGGAGTMIVATGVLSTTSYSVAVGVGGAGGYIGSAQGGDGGSSTFGSILTALGGGGGGTYGIGAGRNGGCGGGGSELAYIAGGALGLGSVSSPLTITSNLAQRGGTGYNDGSQGAAGGGGTSARGQSQTSAASAGRNGGAGTLYRGNYYGGGGGGSQGGTYFGAPYTGGAGGLGGGGTGSSVGASGTALIRGTDGQSYTGSGGGGSTGYTGDETGLRGGAGIVIVSYDYTVGDVDITAPATINLTAPTTAVSGNLTVGGGLTITGDLNMGGHNISNVGTLGATSITTTNFNSAIATPITNPGNIIFYGITTPSTFSGDYTMQIWGAFDGSNPNPVGNLPSGVYSFIAICTSNSRRSLSCVFFVSTAGPFGAQANVLDSTDFVQIYTTTSGSYGYLTFNNTTTGGGDTFSLQITLISGVWDGSASWRYV